MLLVSLALVFLASCTTDLPKSPTSIPPTPPSQEEKMMKEDSMTQPETMIKEDAMMSGSLEKPIKDDTLMKKDDMMEKDEEAIIKPTGYIEYDAAQVDSALASGQKVALFFHATWCPSCKALDKSLTADTVPSDAIIFKVDYDTSSDLKSRYRVVGQHTTVILNADGTEKSKKLGARNVSEVFN